MEINGTTVDVVITIVAIAPPDVAENESTFFCFYSKLNSDNINKINTSRFCIFKMEN